MEITDHFRHTQQIERVNIKHLFENYFKHNNCDWLTITSIEDSNSFDCLFISGRSRTVVMEYKRREIELFTHPDCLFEFIKCEPLFAFHQAGNHVYYAIQYNDYLCVWSLSQLFNKEAFIYQTYGLSYPFYYHRCTSSCDPGKYARGEKEKLVRGLKFHDAEFFLDSDLKKYSYQEVLARHVQK